MHICTVGRSATVVKPKVNGQFEIFSKATVKPLHSLMSTVKSVKGQAKF